MRPIIFLVIAFTSVCAVSLNTFWEENDTKRLSKILESVLETKKDNIASLHYAASGLKLLNEVCEIARKAELTKLETLYHVSALAGDLKDCALTNVVGAQKAIEDVLTESKPSGERITQALRSADRLGIKVDKAAFDKILTAAMKDDSPNNLAWVFNAAALLDKAQGAKYFEKIKNLVSQADEVDSRFLQFDGGLMTTSNAIHGIMSLAEQQGKVPAVTKDQLLLFANYLLSRKHVSTEKSAFHLLSALGVLVNNHQLVPVVVSLRGSVMISRGQPIVIAVCNVFGLPVTVKDVRVDIIPPGRTSPDLGNLRLQQSNVAPRLFVFGPDKMSDAPGMYTVNVRVETEDKRLIGLTGSTIHLQRPDDVVVEDLKVGVLEKDDVVTGANLASVAQFAKHSSVITADHTKRLYASFSVKSKFTGRLVQPHQAFVLFKHMNGAEVFYTADVQTGGKYIVDIADFILNLPPAPVEVVPKSQRINYDVLPEIKHIFRQPEKRPSTIVSDAFTLICLSPLLLLFVLWFRIGLNFGNMPLNLWTLIFHGSLTALFVLYFIFWLQLNMFVTLKYLAVVSALTYLAGNRVLKAIADKRKINRLPLFFYEYSPQNMQRMSLTKNLKSLTSIGPRAIVTWDKAERIRRNEEIWANPDSIVHRLPEHYCKRYWDNLLRDVTPVHYRPPTSRLYWDPVRKVEVEAENFPLLVIHPPEADQGLWGGEGVVKGWRESRPYTKKKVLPRQWIPRLYFPAIKKAVLYSEILDKIMEVTVTERALRLIEQHFGLDYYILQTAEIDLASTLGNRLVLKREMLLTLAKGTYYPDDEERYNYIKQKYAEFVIPVEEAEWVGLTLNEAARKQQEIEEQRVPVPMKFKFERELIARLRAGADLITNEEEFAPKTEESKFGERLLGKYLNPVARRILMYYFNMISSSASVAQTLMLLRGGSTIRRITRMAVRQIASGNQHLAVRAGLNNNPGKTLFVDGDNIVSYGDFQLWSGRYAGVLSGKYGISKGDRVLCRTSKTLDSVALYMACLQLGAIYVPLNPSYTLSETEHFVEDSTPKLMVTCEYSKDCVFRDRIANVLNENSLSNEAKEAAAMLDIEHVDSSDVACVCYTSGTTGLPKGAMLTHGSLSSNAEALVDAWRFTENDKLLHMLPFYHVHGMFISLNCSLFSHSTVIWRDRFSLHDCLEWLPSATVMMGVPTYYSRLLSSPGFSGDRLQHLRLFVSGSAPLSTPLWEEFKSRTGHAILERYGMTEAYHLKLRINAAGGVEIKGSSLFAGYWKKPEKTAQDFTDDKYFITGDLGAVDEDGFLRILGRGKDLIISGGFNVYAKEVEDCIDRLPDIGESAVIGVPHKDLGEVVVAVVSVNSSKPINEKKKEAEIITALKDLLVKYKVPRRVIFVPSLPRNSMAKVQKNELREKYKHICDEHCSSKDL
ncbi:Ribophorin II [Trichostrongylus colubriformis]|uniref:Ribophorin II n=1 Tax=Trichostrongylus colubriformis TaxID=6319 RepID=A0AAN8J2G5_TRICO